VSQPSTEQRLLERNLEAIPSKQNWMHTYQIMRYHSAKALEDVGHVHSTRRAST